MRIKKLKIKNINSFVGEYEIDFERFRGLFLISGPTGSGKTTIVDAITAAIYNKTPRLSNTKELINKDTKEAFIELLFELEGDEYKIRWRGKKRPSGVEVKRKLFINGIEKEDREKDIDKKIKEKLKLSFSEFTKAVVLAQGKFDAFLSAKSDEKMKVLESILDISEFEKISIKVFEKYKELHTEIEEFRRKLGEIEVESEDLIKKEDELKKLNAKLLQKSELLKEFEKKFELLKEKRKLILENEKILKEIESIKKELEKMDVLSFEESFEKAKKEFEEFEGYFNSQVEYLEKEIKKEIELKNLQKNIEELKTREKNGESFISSLKNQLDDLKNKISELKEKKEKITFYKDEALDRFDEIYENYLKLQTLEKEYKEKKLKLKEIKKDIEEFKKELQKNRVLLKDKEEKKEYLEAKLIVLKYESERKLLKENEPCPLCGSLEHPFVKNPPDFKEDIKKEYDEVLKEIEKINNQISNLEVKIKTLESLEVSIKKELDEIVNRGKKLRDIVGEIEIEELKRKKTHNENAKKEFERLGFEIEKKEIEIKKIDENLKRYEKELKKIKEEIKIKEKETLKYDLKIKDPSLKKENLKKEYEGKKRKFEEIRNFYLKQKEKFLTLQTTLKEKNGLYKKHLKRIGEIDIEDENYEEKIALLKEELESLNILRGKFSKEMEFMKKELEKKERILSEVAKKEEKFQIVSKLNDAIGSKDGKKFKQIAINKMIDGILFVANIHLEKLSDGRYLLVKGENIKKIELDVIDRFYENKKRSVNTLSGGERFLVSLSLAFALSDLMRDKVKIDFMFLDEGFGTLDAYNLMKTLEILKKASVGKTIGIISHVEALKEEIDKGIKIIKTQNGKSKIEIY